MYPTDLLDFRATAGQAWEHADVQPSHAEGPPRRHQTRRAWAHLQTDRRARRDRSDRGDLPGWRTVVEGPEGVRRDRPMRAASRSRGDSGHTARGPKRRLAGGLLGGGRDAPSPWP